jgi:hypothetical protein
MGEVPASGISIAKTAGGNLKCIELGIIKKNFLGVIMKNK